MRFRVWNVRNSRQEEDGVPPISVTDSYFEHTIGEKLDVRIALEEERMKELCLPVIEKIQNMEWKYAQKSWF